MIWELFCEFGSLLRGHFCKLDFVSIRLILIDTVLLPAKEFFTYLETSPSPEKGCKMLAYARCPGLLNREGSLLSPPAVTWDLDF
jgi:hypothetical protein